MSEVPVLRALLPYGAGIVSGYIGTSPDVGFACMIPVSLFLAGMLLEQTLGKGRTRISGMLFCTAVTGALFFCGRGYIAAGSPEDPGLPTNLKLVVCGTVTGISENSNGRTVYSMDVEMVHTPDTCYPSAFLARCYLGRGLDSTRPVTGEQWVLTGKLRRIVNSGNPGENDFAVSMENLNIWYTFFAEGPAYANHPFGYDREKISWIQKRSRLRERIASRWSQERNACSLLRAVCMGDRAGLGPEIKDSFARAGGMHLLAVSGMHVGLIWLVLHRIFYILVAISGKEISRFIPIFIILWCFAWFAGFSSPVIRAVTIFSLYSFSRLFSWKADSVHMVLAAMLVMLVADPVRAFQPAFQLSFGAVLAILSLQPLIRSLWSPGIRLLKWIWEATTVSLAAQIGILPLVIYYFQQIPVYGILTNLLSVPVLSCILICFVAGFPFLYWGTGAGIAGKLMVFQARLLIRMTETIASFPGALITGFPADAVVTLLLCLLVFLLILYLNTRNFPLFLLAGAVLGLVLFISAAHHTDRIRGREALVMNFYGESMVTIREGKFADHYLWTGEHEPSAGMEHYLDHAWGTRTFRNSFIRLFRGKEPEDTGGEVSSCIQISEGIRILGNDRITVLVISGQADPDPGIFGLQPDLVVFRENPELAESSMEQLISKADHLVADGSNSAWYIARMAENHAEIYPTPSLGAFSVTY